jgi:hypothetical protein
MLSINPLYFSFTNLRLSFIVGVSSSSSAVAHAPALAEVVAPRDLFVRGFRGGQPGGHQPLSSLQGVFIAGDRHRDADRRLAAHSPLPVSSAPKMLEASRSLGLVGLGGLSRKPRRRALLIVALRIVLTSPLLLASSRTSSISRRSVAREIPSERCKDVRSSSIREWTRRSRSRREDRDDSLKTSAAVAARSILNHAQQVREGEAPTYRRALWHAAFICVAARWTTPVTSSACGAHEAIPSSATSPTPPDNSLPNCRSGVV